jgi:S1-C subfamily serine protease
MMVGTKILLITTNHIPDCMGMQNLFLVFLVGILGAMIGSLISVSVFLPLVVQDAVGGLPQNEETPAVHLNVSGSLQDYIFTILEENDDSVVHVRVNKAVQTPIGTQTSRATGSGFVISEAGYIATNHHVVSDAEEITVVFNDGTEEQATLRGSDPLNDVAVIKINPTFELNPVEIGDSDNITQGEIVLAIGSPFSLQNSVTLGIVSALQRTLISEGGYRVEDVIQTDASINPGNSGGPLLNLKGEVVGINTAIISQSGGSEGIGFAIPINTAQGIYKELIETGKVARPWLGISGVDLSRELVQQWGIGIDTGVLIVDFPDYSPSRDAGLRETLSRPGKKDFVIGDIITEIGSETINNNTDLLNTLLKYRPGDIVDVRVYRDGSYFTFSVELGERPEGM